MKAVLLGQSLLCWAHYPMVNVVISPVLTISSYDEEFYLCQKDFENSGVLYKFANFCSLPIGQSGDIDSAHNIFVNIRNEGVHILYQKPLNYKSCRRTKKKFWNYCPVCSFSLYFKNKDKLTMWAKKKKYQKENIVACCSLSRLYVFI